MKFESTGLPGMGIKKKKEKKRKTRLRLLTGHRMENTL